MHTLALQLFDFFPGKALFFILISFCTSQLDDWVLCRIYKKNSSSQKPSMSSLLTKEHSNNGSSSSSSSHLDDVLDFPEIDHRFFNLPRMNSLKTLQQDDKLNFQNTSSGNFDWASLAGLNSVAELVSGNQTQAQCQEPVSFNNNDMYVPSIPPLCHVESPLKRFSNSMDEEVQSGLRNQRVDNSGFLHNNSNVLTQNYSNSHDPYGFRYPTHTTTGFGFRQ